MASTSKPSDIFQASLTIERQWLRQVVTAVLGTIMFHRYVGNFRPSTFDCAGCTFPVPGEAEVEALINSNAEAVVRQSFESASAHRSKTVRLVVAFFPTPTPTTTTAHRRQSSGSAAATTGTPKSRPIAPTVTSALGWFSASAAKALSGGSSGDDSSGNASTGTGSVGSRSRDSTPTEQEWQEFGRMWEAWVIDLDVKPDGGVSSNDDRLTAQLNDFLLRSLTFVMDRTTSVPPITTADLQPFGMQILINPSLLPFALPKQVVQTPKYFPKLHSSLVNTRRTTLAP
ncbi:hypothetical protein ACM66B_001729 [Microbotryomycetes sp. NB124-2]